MKRIVVAVVVGIFLVAVPAFAEEERDLFEQENHCNKPGAWEGWEKLVAKYPNDLSLQALHALRIGLCVKIEQGSIRLDDAIEIFDDAHNLVIQKAKSEHEKKGPSL